MANRSFRLTNDIASRGNKRLREMHRETYAVGRADYSTGEFVEYVKRACHSTRPAHRGGATLRSPTKTQLLGPLPARSPGLRPGLAPEIERHCSTDEILQSRLIDLVALVDVDGAPDIPVEAGVEQA